MFETDTGRWVDWLPLGDLAWPLVLLLAWLAGEWAYRALRLPRICVYALVGFAAAPTQLGWLPDPAPALALYGANLAFGLILFEFGYRINLRWFWRNPWLVVAGLMESLLTLLAVLALARLLGLADRDAWLVAVLAMASSPAAILRVIHERRSAGQITERVLHLAALNCVLSVLAFKLLLGQFVFQQSGNLLQALYASSVVVLGSAVLGLAAGALVPGLLRLLGGDRDCTPLFVLGVALLVALTYSLRLSPIVAALAFGLTVRQQGIVFGRAQRGFGTLGELLSLLLFIFIASRIDGPAAVAGLGLGLALVLVRLLAKAGAVALLARPSGTTVRKGLLTGLALTPLSAFVILLLEQTRHMGVALNLALPALAAMVLVLELLGPAVLQLALRLGGELPDECEGG